MGPLSCSMDDDSQLFSSSKINVLAMALLLWQPHKAVHGHMTVAITARRLCKQNADVG